ncbi:MAG: DUF3187 family protein [Proteobacteria bacterium]|nr:DUF3187 family protein [Pseudomonadota bacterium]MCG2831503.1 DUF3187 family protein [Desulfobacteraceae bacterium]MBU4125956.1 DUF3187 family protein [Pseudomonadota bacterium]MBU4389335.1 DUF3187 family protein [Pseudomonadota bacterium]MBU4420561.1 DUF3187 family protein [Pseudomonadota bacterium]
MKTKVIFSCLYSHILRMAKAAAHCLNKITCASLLLAFLCPIAAFSEDTWENWQERSGPISLVNQSPIQLLFLQPIPDRADTLPKGHSSIRLNTTITNTFLSQESEHYAATVDMETIRTSLEVSYGVTPCLELGVSLPAAHHYSGFMDKPIREVERMSGKIRKVRQEEDANEFAYVVKKDDEVFMSGSKNSTGMQDLVLRAKGRVWDEDNILPGLSVRLAVKLPTGDEDRAFGSGKADWGLGLLLQKNINRMSAYLNADVTFPGDAFDDAGISLREFYTIMIGAEYRFTQQLSAIAQMNWITRPFEDTGLDMLEKRISELLIGLNYFTKSGIFIQIGGVEDIFDSCESGADFTFFLNIGLSL